MNIVKSYNRQSGITYVYEVLESHYDKEKGHAVPKRRLIGKIDPETGEVVPTGKRGRPRNAKATATDAPVSAQTVPTGSTEPDYKQLYLELQKSVQAKDEYITALESALVSIQSSIASSASKCSELLVSLRSIHCDVIQVSKK